MRGIDLMWRPLALAVFLIGPVFAHAQTLPSTDGLLPKMPGTQIRLELSVEQTKLIAQTLGAIGCGNVQQMMVCEQAAELLREIRKQATEQVK
jgi:hypothetical protein